MRKVTFHIDDKEYFRTELIEKDKLTPEQAENIVADIRSFVATYSLIGKGKSADRYELYNDKGEKISINDVNNYEKGVILNECMAYFEGRKGEFGGDRPTGVISIVEEEIGEEDISNG